MSPGAISDRERSGKALSHPTRRSGASPRSTSVVDTSWRASNVTFTSLATVRWGSKSYTCVLFGRHQRWSRTRCRHPRRRHPRRRQPTEERSAAIETVRGRRPVSVHIPRSNTSLFSHTRVGSLRFNLNRPGLGTKPPTADTHYRTQKVNPHTSEYAVAKGGARACHRTKSKSPRGRVNNTAPPHPHQCVGGSRRT